MKIEKLPSGNYRVRKMFRGKTYTVIFDHEPNQKEALRAIADEMENEKEKAIKMTFRKAAEEYISVKENVLSPSTVREYTRNIDRLSDKFTSIRISDVTALDVQKEINALSKDKSPKTVRNYHGFISAVLGMFRPRLILNTTLPQSVKNEQYIPSDDDVKMIIKDVEGSMFEVAILLACFGLRRSEILALTIDDLHEDNTIIINKAKVQNENKEWIIKTTKTTESTRTVVIPSSLADKIREQGFVYNGSPNSITGHLNDVQDRLGIPRFSIHKLRHYFASKMSELGIPAEDILKMGGWSSDHVMKSVYRHSLQTKKAQQEASDKLSKSLFS